MPEDKWKIYENKAENYGGVAIYRDGFRVLPMVVWILTSLD